MECFHFRMEAKGVAFESKTMAYERNMSNMKDTQPPYASQICNRVKHLSADRRSDQLAFELSQGLPDRHKKTFSMPPLTTEM
jgi:hypothetical protein